MNPCPTATGYISSYEYPGAAMTFGEPPPGAAPAVRAAGTSAAVAADSAVIEFDQISKAFVLPRGSGQGELLALDRVSFAIRKNEFTTVVGPSGCGKSTLLRLVAGLTPPSGGRTIYKG